MFEQIFSEFLSLGYLGIFLITLIGTATIFFPLPVAIFIFGAGALLNPLILGIVAGLGAAIGEIPAYVLGLGGKKIVEKKQKEREQIEKANRLFLKYGGFLIVVIFAATPLPDDIVGITCGVLKYNIKKFLLAVFIGKTILFLIIAYAGYYGVNWLLNYFGL